MHVKRPSPRPKAPRSVISLAGQISVVLVYVMEPLKRATGSYVVPLLLFAALVVVSASLATTLVEGHREY